MPFIGIRAKESDSNFIKNEIIKNSENNKFEIININKRNIENYKNIKFETLLVNEDMKDFMKSSNYINDIINNVKYLIINSDIVQNQIIIQNEMMQVITYGLNQNAIITVSSIENENIILYIQKKFYNNEGNLIDEQEFSIEIEKKNRKKVCNSMGIFAILTIYGEKIKKI